MQLNEIHNPHEHASVSLKVILLIFVVLLVGVLTYLVWDFKTTSDTTSNSATPTVTKTDDTTITENDETAGWKTFTASAQGDKIVFKYPAEYSVSENTDGFISVKDSSGKIIADITAATGTHNTNVTYVSTVSNDWFKTSPTSTTVVTKTGFDCKKLVGTFGEKAASFNSIPDGSHEGIVGTTFVCKGDAGLVRVLNSYDTGNSSMSKIADLIIDTLS